MSLWRELISDNPLVTDRSILVRRLVGGSQTGRLVLAAVLLGVVLLMLSAIAGLFPQVMTPKAVVYIQTGLFCFLPATMLYGAVASEREKRTWDLLAVAPLTGAQIVIGKYLAAMSLVFAVFIMFLVPAGISEAARVSGGSLFYWAPDAITLPQYIGIQGISIVFAAALGAVSLFVSCLFNRGFTALLTVLTLEAGALILAPILIGVALPFGVDYQAFLSWHPFFAIEILSRVPERGVSNQIADQSAALISPAICVVVTGVALWLAAGSAGVPGAPRRLRDAGA